MVTLWLAVHHDLWWSLAAACLVVAALVAGLAPRIATAVDPLMNWAVDRAHPVLWLTIFAAAIAAVGVDLVQHRFGLSFDEFLVVWQAKVFLAGHLLAPIPDGWEDLAKFLQPVWMHYDLANGLWTPHYQPLSSALYALFDLFALGPWSNALLAGGSVALTAAIARRAWPTERQAPGLAALMLATSPQLLITAMTPYAMTGHLFLNLLWLWLYLADTRRGHLLAALVGLVACGLHQPHVHPLFIAPFMISLLWQRRWRLAFFYAAWYMAVLVFWIHWRDLAIWWVTGGGQIPDAGGGERLSLQVLEAIGAFQPHLLVLVFASWARFIAWQSPLAILLVLPALLRLRQAPYLVRMLLWSFLLTVVAHAVLVPGQGLGWGYRYLHVHLGSVALIGVWGWLSARQVLQAPDRIALARLGTVLLLAGVLVALPLRSWQTESFVRPFALADQYIKGLEVDVVFVDDRDIWFGVALVRNDPLLRNAPKVLAAHGLPVAPLKRICAERTAVLLDHPSSAGLGLRQRPHWSSVPHQPPDRLRRSLMEGGCNLAAPPRLPSEPSDYPEGAAVLSALEPLPDGVNRDRDSPSASRAGQISATTLAPHASVTDEHL